MELKEIIVSSCAIVGALLGVFNLVRGYLADSERGTLSIVESDALQQPRLEVVNRSPFPITITELGTVHPEGQVSGVGLNEGYVEINALPMRIEARHSHTFRIDMRAAIDRRVHVPTYTFARTALGRVITTEGRPARWWRCTKETLHLKNRDL